MRVGGARLCPRRQRCSDRLACAASHADLAAVPADTLKLGFAALCTVAVEAARARLDVTALGCARSCWRPHARPLLLQLQALIWIGALRIGGSERC